MLVLESVGRVYRGRGRPRVALRDVTLRADAGRMIALVGENGAGKSTLLRIAATLDEPTTGRVLIGGVDPRDDGAAARRRVAYLAQDSGLYDAFTVRENLEFVARFFGRLGDVERAARSVGIEASLDARAGGLSRGERQRCALARTLVSGDVMLLDEPTTALDADGRDLALGALREAARSRVVLVATHDESVAAAADAVLRLRGGALEAEP